MSICIHDLAPGCCCCTLPGSGEVRGLRRRMHQQQSDWARPLLGDLASNLDITISAPDRRSHSELVTATTELALGWWWSGQGRYTGAQEGAGRWRSGHQIQTRDTEAAWPAEVPAQLPGRRHRHHRCLAWEQEPPHTPTVKLRARLPRPLSHYNLHHPYPLLQLLSRQVGGILVLLSFILLWSTIIQEQDEPVV